MYSEAAILCAISYSSTTQLLATAITKCTFSFYSQGKTVTLKLKMVSFQVRQRSTSFSRPISEFDEIYQAASTLLAAEMKACAPLPLRVRLMGEKLIALYHEYECLTPCTVA